jgi:hypothetical protein
LKKLSFLLIILAITCTFGCERYPDGPLISLRSVDTRIAGGWQMVSFTSNGVDSLQSIIDSTLYTLSIPEIDPKNHSNVLQIAILGNWTFSDNKTIMNVNFPTANYYPFHVPAVGPFKLGYLNEKWKILKLEMMKLEISTVYNGRNYLMSFKKV